MAEVKLNQGEQDVLEWIPIRSEEDYLNVETGIEKLVRKCKENPFVPIGAIATTGCLCYGLYSFRRGEKRMSQLMMRARVVAQGFTIAALVGGLLLASKNTIPKKS